VISIQVAPYNPFSTSIRRTARPPPFYKIIDKIKLRRLRSTLLGDAPEILQPDLVSTPNRNKMGMVTEDTVEVFVRFNVAFQEFAANNLVTKNQTLA